MKKITRKNVQQFCRTCLADTTLSKKFSVHEIKELAEWIVTFTSVPLDKYDVFPKFLCQRCYKKIKLMDEFRLMCKRSMNVLEDALRTSKNPLCTDRDDSKIAPEEHEEVFKEIYGNKDWLDFDYNVTPMKPLKKSPTAVEDVDNKDLVMQAILEPNEVVMEPDEYKKEFESDYEMEKEMPVPSSQSNENSISAASLEDQRDALEASDEDFELRTASGHGSSSDSDDMVLSQLKTKKRKRQSKQPKQKLAKKRKHYSKKASPPPKKFEIKYHCDSCPRRFISQDNLDAHMRTHQGLRPFKCTKCERSFNRKAHLTGHINEVHAEHNANIVCEFEGCDKVFQRELTYKAHYRLKHSGKQPQWRTYICEDCGRSFKNITMLREHRYKHIPEEEYPFQCEQCGKRYTTQRTYKEHLMRHAGIKNFECPHCGMKKTTRNELRTHINYHTKEKQFPCPHCPSVFNSSANLGMHDRIVHKGIRRFSCRYCDLSFGKPDTLKHHEMRHTGEKPHACHICDKRFIQAVALRTHLKTHGKELARKQEEQRVIAQTQLEPQAQVGIIS